MKKELIPIGRIAQAIHLLREQKVILDSDLAQLYGVAAKVLNQAVKRNRERFPDDFMFQLTAKETSDLKSQFVISNGQSAGNESLSKNWSQFVTSSRKHRGQVYRPYAFTEQGVAMLSSVLKSDRAVKVNIAIMRAFVRLREALETNRELARKFAELDERVGKHDKEIGAIIDAIRQLMAPPEKPRREIGFHVREKTPRYRTRNRR
jgi:hypothetical protein